MGRYSRIFSISVMLIFTFISLAFSAPKHTLMREDVGLCNPLVYGSTLNDTTLSAAIAGCSEKTFMLTPGTWTIGANLAIPAGKTIRILSGATLSIAAGKTLTVSGFVDAGEYQIVSGSGRLSLAKQNMKASWRGAACDGSTTDTTAIQAAIDDAELTGVDVEFPYGVCLSAAVTVDDDGVALVGKNAGSSDGSVSPGAGTTLRATAAVTGSFISFGAGTIRFDQGIRNLSIDLSTNGGSNAVGIDMVSSQYFRLQNVYIGGTFPAANSQIGLRMIDGTHAHIEDLKINGGNTGIVVQPNNGNSVNDLIVNRAWVSTITTGLLIDQQGTGVASNNLFNVLYCEGNMTYCIQGTTSTFTNWAFINVHLDGTFTKWISVVSGTRAFWIGGPGADSESEWDANTTNADQWMVISRDFVQFPAVDTVLGGNVIINEASSFQHQRHLYGSAAYDPANLVAGASVNTDVTVSNSNVGDLCIVGFPMRVGAAGTSGIMITCAIKAAATANVVFTNTTGGAIDLDSGTIKVLAIQGATYP